MGRERGREAEMERDLESDRKGLWVQCGMRESEEVGWGAGGGRLGPWFQV